MKISPKLPIFLAFNASHCLNINTGSGGTGEGEGAPIGVRGGDIIISHFASNNISNVYHIYSQAVPLPPPGLNTIICCSWGLELQMTPNPLLSSPSSLHKHTTGDPDVLDIFKSAASSWMSQGRDVWREDWREVCSILTPRALAFGKDVANSRGFLREDEAEQGEDDGRLQTDQSEASDSVEYYEGDEEEAGADDDGGDDDYEASSRRHSTIAIRSGVEQSAKTKGKGGGKTSAPSTRSDLPFELSGIPRTKVAPRQETEPLRTFALFFPGVELTHLGARENTQIKKSLEKKQIIIKDVTRVGATGGESSRWMRF